jgi:hypothetical protein
VKSPRGAATSIVAPAAVASCLSITTLRDRLAPALKPLIGIAIAVILILTGQVVADVDRGWTADRQSARIGRLDLQRVIRPIGDR